MNLFFPAKSRRKKAAGKCCGFYLASAAKHMSLSDRIYLRFYNNFQTILRLYF